MPPKKYRDVDEMCTLLQQIELVDCIPMIRKHGVNGKMLSVCPEKEFVSWMQKEGMLEFKARSAWRTLQEALHR